jgi:hypothetical protein
VEAFLSGFEIWTQSEEVLLRAKAERPRKSIELQLRAPTVNSNLIALLLFYAETRYCQNLPQV